MDEFGDEFFENIIKYTNEVFTEVESGSPMAAQLKGLASKFSGSGYKFGGI